MSYQSNYPSLIPTELVSKHDAQDLLEWYDEDDNKLYEFGNFEIIPTDDTDNTEYINFCEFIEQVLSGDCWAVKVNDEILFNYFNEHEKSYRDRILDDVIRQELIDDVHGSLFVQLFRKNKDADIIIYMFGDETWAYKIEFCGDTVSFKISLL
jgi:hypothetical protein